MSAWLASGQRRELGIWALGLLVFVPVAALLAWHRFDGLYGQDSFSYEAYAVGPARDALLRGNPVGLPNLFFPPGYPIVAAFASLLLGPGSLAAAAIALIAGSCVPIATALVARELGTLRSGPPLAGWVPLLAGAVTGLTPHLWQSSGVVMSDTTGLAFAVVGTWALLRYARGLDLTWLLLAAGLIAAAVETRWAYGLLAVPLVALALWLATKAPGRPGRGHVDRRFRATIGPIIGSIAVAALVLAPMLAPIVGAIVAGRPVPFVGQLQTHVWDPANLARSALDGPDGHQVYPLPMALFYLLQPAEPYYLTPVFAGFAAVGALAVIRRRDVVDWAVLLAWPALTLAFLAGGTTQNTRFALAVLPPLAILAARGAALVAAWLHDRSCSEAGQRLIAGAVVVALAGMGAFAVRFTDDFISRWEADRATLAALAAEVPPEAHLLSFGATATLQWLGREPVDLSQLEPAQVLGLAGDGQQTFVIIPTVGFEDQWAALPPGRDIVALRAGPGLDTVDVTTAWTLLRVP